MDQAIVNSAIAFTAASLLIVLFRFFLRRLQHEKFLPDDWLMLVSIIFYLLFTATFPVIVYNGTSTTEWRESTTSDDDLVAGEILGSKMMLVGRVFYTTYLWCLKACVLIYFARLPIKTSEMLLVEIAAGTLVMTWILAVLTFFLECRPLNLYWQVVPNTAAPDCAKAVIELIVLESLNISTNVFLMIIPTPLLLRARLESKHKVWVAALFLGAFFLITVSILRMAIVTGNLDTQSKGMWGQIECFVATIVANAPSIHEMWHHGWDHMRAGRFGRINCPSDYILTPIPPVQSTKTNHSLSQERRGSQVAQDGASDSEPDNESERRDEIAPVRERKTKLAFRRSVRKVGQKLRSSLESLEIQKSVAFIQERKTGRLTPPPDSPGPVDGEFFFAPNHGNEATARIRTEVSCDRALLGGKEKMPRSWMARLFRGPDGCG